MSKVPILKQRLNDLLSRGSVYSQSSSRIPKLDYTELVKRLKPEELGKDRGEIGLPPLGYVGPDEVEQKINNTLQDLIDDTAHDVNEGLAAYSQRIMSLNLSGEMDDIRDVGRGAMGSFQAQVYKGQETLIGFKEILDAKNFDLKLFKTANGLERSANYPSVGQYSIKATVLIVLFLIESLANASFLAISNVGGLVGAYSESIVISFLNIATACLLGLFISRHINNHLIFKRLTTFLAIFTCLIAAGFFNLAVAHYRDLASLGLFGDAGVLAIQRLLAEPFSLSDIQSWVLFLVGWLFWTISLIEAHTMDDTYPNYGKIDRSAKLARESFTDETIEIIEKLTDLKTDSEAEIKQTRAQLSAVHNQQVSIIDMRKSLLAEYDFFTDQAGRMFSQLIETYRNSNRANRSRSPSSFKDKLILTLPKLQSDDVSKIVDTTYLQVQKSKDELDRSLDQFYEAFHAALNSFSIDQYLNTEQLSKIEIDNEN